MDRFTVYRLVVVTAALAFVAFANWLATKEVRFYKTEMERAHSALRHRDLMINTEQYRDFVRLSLIDTETPDAR